MKRVWLLFGLWMSCEAQVLTLNDAVALALKENRSVQISELDVAKAGEATAETKTSRLPQLSAYILGGESLTPIDFTIPRGALGVYPSIGPIPAQNASISTPQNFNALIYRRPRSPSRNSAKLDSPSANRASAKRLPPKACARKNRIPRIR
jgi:Outer membrane efflux protein